MTLVIGTAGHIDHGKTSLLRALTGIDADRLPEEQRRGMTIEPGHAHADFGAGPLSLVGVPYTEADIAGAAAAVEGKTEQDALVAYLQGLGIASKTWKAAQ